MSASAPVPMQNTDQPSEHGCSGAFSHRWMYTCYSGLMKVVCNLHPQLKLKRVCLLFSKHLHHEVRYLTRCITSWCDCDAVALPGLLPAEAGLEVQRRTQSHRRKSLRRGWNSLWTCAALRWFLSTGRLSYKPSRLCVGASRAPFLEL